MALGLKGPRLADEDSRRIVAARPGDALGMDGASRDRRSSVEAGPGAFRTQFARLGQQPAEPAASVFSSRRGSAEAEPWSEPFPERIEELSSPSPEASPALRLDLRSELPSDVNLLPVLDQVEAEGLEDRRPRVPPAGMEDVDEDADRVLATSAEIPANTDDEVDRHRVVAEDLTRVGAVTHDAERLVRLMRRIPAERA